MADFGGGISQIGSGIGGLFAAKGYAAAAVSYDKAAGLERVNARISKASTEIQLSAVHRDLLKSIGGQQSDIAAAGFAMGGSALDLAADTARQGSLAESLTTAQGAIDYQGHVLQAENYSSQAEQMRAQAKASKIGGIFGIIGGIFSMFSDERMKTDIRRIGTDKRGLPVVAFRYKADPTGTDWIGYLAQDVEQYDPTAVRDLGMKMIDSAYAPVRA